MYIFGIIFTAVVIVCILGYLFGIKHPLVLEKKITYDRNKSKTEYVVPQDFPFVVIGGVFLSLAWPVAWISAVMFLPSYYLFKFFHNIGEKKIK